LIFRVRFAVRITGFVWGIGGIFLLLCFAIFRLGGVAVEALGTSLDSVHWLVLGPWVIYMLWAEGYKGFHRGFAPRVVARAYYLSHNPRPLHVLLAPLFCMGYIHATRRRQLMSLGLTSMIVFFVILIRMLPQPWRGIVDTGVVAGLILGVLSIVFFLTRLAQDPENYDVETDVPARVTPETA